MAVNLNDDYEKLAKLIYPSIEASGNVYYGQTRKLTLDEVLKKNDLGFESYTSSDLYNNKHFCWKLGPLHDSFEIWPDETLGVCVLSKDGNTHTVVINTIETLCEIIDDQDGNLSYDDLTVGQKLYGTLWAKYIIHTNSKTIDNILYSGDYKTYEKDISIELSNIVCTYYTDPVDNTEDISNKNFIVDLANQCLYVKIYTAVEDDNYIEPEYTAIQLAKPFTITVKSGSCRILLSSNSTVFNILYKKNNDEWVDVLNESRYVDLNTNDSLLLKGYISTYNRQINIEAFPGYTAELEFSGNINSLVDADNYAAQGTALEIPNNAFSDMFSSFYHHIDCSTLILPSETSNNCYDSMFEGSGITNPPAYLHADTIAPGAYMEMFKNCTSLIATPRFPNHIYLEAGALNSMFKNCTSLVTISNKNLNITLSQQSLNAQMNTMLEMFAGCTSLKIASNITVYGIIDHGQSVFSKMFAGCTSLKKSPKLSNFYNIDITSSSALCNNMFDGCTSLNYVACDAGDNFNYSNDFTSWLNNVSSTGIFYKNDNNTSWTSGPSGIPEGWTVKNWSELPADPVNGFNIQYLSNPEYTNKVLLTSGVDSSDNGRGILNTSTVYSMSTLFDEDNKHQINTCSNSSGSYNQDVWGYKTFNSPVKFRNGIYGETCSLVATTVDNKNVTKLSLYDSTLYGVSPDNSDFINKPHIQLGYEVRADDQEYDSVIEFKANKIRIDGKLETANSNGLIPYIPTELSPDDSIDDTIEVGELCQLLVRGVPNSISSDIKWSEGNSNWVYQGFVKQSSTSNYVIYYNSNNSSQCQYARYLVGASASADNVEYADSYDDYATWQTWETVWNNDSTSYDGTSVRFGIWENYGEHTDVNGNMATVYKNDWAKFDDAGSSYTTVYYWVYDDSGIPSGISTDCINNETSASEAAVAQLQDYPYNMFLQENNNWVLEVSPSSSNDMIYYNSNNTDCKIYNATTDYYYYDYNEDITSADSGHNIEYGEEEYSASNQNWKPFGIFYNSTNTNSNNKYFRNYNYDGTYTYMSNGNGSYYGSAADPTVLNHSFTSIATIPEYYVHYGTVLYKSNSKWYLNDDDHEVEVYLVTINPSLTDASLRYSVGTLNIQSSLARFVTLSSALTSTDSSTVPSGNTSYIFYAQRLQNQGN
jgi:hypothetical protein